AWDKGKRVDFKGPYKFREIIDPESPADAPRKRMQEYADLAAKHKLRYESNIDAMNWILLGIPNYIYNSVDAYVNASRAKRAARNHDPLALVANAYVSPLSSQSSQQYYVTHPLSIQDYDDDYKGEIQGDEPEDKLSTSMMLLARAITQHFSTPTNNRLCTSFNMRNQDYVQNGRVDLKGKSSGGHYARDYSMPIVRDLKYFKEQMLLAAKDEVEVQLDEEENNFMLMNANRDDQLEEANASMIMMAHLKPPDNDSDSKPTYDSNFFTE
nr:hypothetical protein [Tanacetum cinerariifolium]GEZ73786.1 hypothetical protein [Tanacetum cinerariifolium]